MTPSVTARKAALSTLYSFLLATLLACPGLVLAIDLNREISQIDASIEETRSRIRTVQDARFLPDLYLTLAELLIEKSRFMVAAKVESQPNTPLSELDLTVERRPKWEAIQTYKLIVERFDKHPDRDKALFLKAHEYRELNEKTEMIRVYNQLLQEHPQSEFWAQAKLIVADFHLEERKDLEYALQHYLQILPRQDSPVRPLALYKIGWIFVNQEKFPQAIRAYEEVLRTDFEKFDTTRLPPTYQSINLQRDALLALVWPYSEVPPQQLPRLGRQYLDPLNYFRSLSPDRASYERVLQRLGQRMEMKKRHVEAVAAYTELFRISTDLPTRLEAALEAYRAMRNTKAPWPIYGFNGLIKDSILELLFSDEIPPNEKQTHLRNMEIFARDNATRLQRVAQRTRKERDWQQAIDEYRNYLVAFPRTQFSLRMQQNLAETYFLSGQFHRAALEYEQLVRKTSGQQARDYLDSSIQSYIRALRSQDELSRLELTEARNGLRQTGLQFVRQQPEHSASADIWFNIAQSYYDERDFDNAIRFFNQFIDRHPSHSNAAIAANLILDAYNQQEDFSGLAQAARKILANNNITDSQLKRQVAQIMQQAELQRVQKEAGDFSSPDYAANLLQLAGKYQGSSLGDKALFEAFVSFRSRQDPQMYEVGEALLLQHQQSPYAQEVATSMAQVALQTADFRRAATYFELFSERYPRHPQANNFLQRAAELREGLGDLKLAARNYERLNRPRDAARMDFLSQDWSGLMRSSTRAQGIEQHYWQGLAQYRLQGIRAARDQLTRASRSPASSVSQQEMAAHALYLLTRGTFEHFESIQMRPGGEAQAIEQKARLLEELERDLNQVIRFGNGRWTIAALYTLGRANREFARFIQSAPTPAGLSGPLVQQYRQALAAQAEQYSTAANRFFSTCIQTASKENVFTRFARGCMSRGEVDVDEAREVAMFLRSPETTPPGTAEIRQQLAKDPGNVDILLRLLPLYVNAQDFAFSELILRRALELRPQDASLMSQMANVKMYQNQMNEAFDWTQQALQISPQEPLANLTQLALFRSFAFRDRLSQAQSRAPASMPQGLVIHPLVREALRSGP